MYPAYRIGELVHIPQATTLVECETEIVDDPQLSIPLRILETQRPEIAIVTQVSEYGYVRVFCSGDSWAVKDKNIYKVEGLML